MKAILFLIKFSLACECQVEPWSDWSACSDTGGRERNRVCSTKWGITLGLACNPADNTPVKGTEFCRKSFGLY